jgi:hypothetical protein
LAADLGSESDEAQAHRQRPRGIAPVSTSTSKKQTAAAVTFRAESTTADEATQIQDMWRNITFQPVMFLGQAEARP